MKIITEAVYQMNDDGSLVLESEKSFDYDGPIAETKSSPSPPPPPDPSIAQIDVWADGGAAWRN